MFLENIDEEERYRVVIKYEDRIFLMFTDVSHFGTSELTTPIWVASVPDERALAVMARWFAMRRDRWQAWGSLTDVIGPDAFAKHLEALMKAEPPEVVTGISFEFFDDPPELIVKEMIADEDGTREDVLYQHQFADAATMDRLRVWVRMNETREKLDALVSIGHARGAAAFAAALEERARPFGHFAQVGRPAE